MPREGEASSATDPVPRALENLGHVVYGFRVDSAGRLPLVFVGPGLGRLLGRELSDDLEEVAGVWAETIHANDRSREAAYMSRLAHGERAWEVYRLVAPDGAVRWVYDQGRPGAGSGEVVNAIVFEIPEAVARSLLDGGDHGEAAQTLSATAYTAELAGGGFRVLRLGADWQQTTGLKADQSAALTTLEQAVHPRDAETFRERLRLLHAGRSFDGEYAIVDAEGRLRRLAERATPRDADGRTLIEGVIVDHADERAPHEPRRGLDARLRRLLETLDAHVYTLVVDGDEAHAEFLGPRLEIIYGEAPPPDVDVDELWAASVYPDDRPAVESRSRRLRNGEDVGIVYRIRGLDGVTRWIRDQARPRRGDDGRMRIDGIAYPLTLDEDEALAVDAGRRIGRVLSELEDAVFELELVDDTWRAVYASPGLARLLGRTPPADAELLDLWVEQLHDEDMPVYLAQDSDLRAGRVARGAYRIVGLDGVTRRVFARAFPVQRPGGPLRAVGIATLLDEAESAPSTAAPELTQRQLEVLALLAEGLSTEAIASRLVISGATVRNHVTAILRELDVHSRLEAVAEARRQLLV